MTDHPHRLFVVGATGYTGRAVVRHGATTGARTVAHIRPDSPKLDHWRAHFTSLGATPDATPWDRAALSATLAHLRPTHIFALLGTTRHRARQSARAGRAGESYESVDYALTRLLLDATLDAERLTGARPRFVYLSAVGAREDTRNGYLRVRGRMERELRESGLPWLIVRPSFITGPGRDERRLLERATARAMDLALTIPALLGARTLRDRYGSITGDALGEGMVRLALDERGPGRVVGSAEARFARRV